MRQGALVFVLLTACLPERPDPSGGSGGAPSGDTDRDARSLRAEIEAPADNDVVEAGWTVLLEGSATLDGEPVGAEASFTWRSSESGPIGTGRDLAWTAEPAGLHTIVLEVELDGLQDRDRIDLRVGEAW